MNDPFEPGLQVTMPELPYGEYELLINKKGWGLASFEKCASKLITNEL
jgi:hypothetical protein